MIKVGQALLVAYVAASPHIDSLRTVLEAVASVKRLQDFRQRQPRPQALPPGQMRRTIPKDRLPFALICFNSLQDYLEHDPRLFAVLYSMMQPYPAQYLPDQIDIIGQGAQYLNPLLEREEANRFDVVWSRTPDRREP